jgi:hypothetical protein
MKKLFLFLLVSASLFSCKEAADSSKSVDQNPLSGTFTERDEKAQRLWTNLNLFIKNDFSYVKDYLAPNYEFRTASDTAVVVRGPEEAIANWKKVHILFKDMSFSEGRIHTFKLNNGEVHTGYFGQLTATGKFTNKTATVPMQIWIKWEGDKVVSQLDMFDSKLIMEEAAAAAAAAAAAPAAK